MCFASRDGSPFAAQRAEASRRYRHWMIRICATLDQKLTERPVSVKGSTVEIEVLSKKLQRFAVCQPHRRVSWLPRMSGEQELDQMLRETVPCPLDPSGSRPSPLPGRSARNAAGNLH